MKMLWIEEKKHSHGENHEVSVEEDEDAAVIETPTALQAAGRLHHAPESHEGRYGLPVGGVECGDIRESAETQADGEGGHAQKDAAHQRLLP